MITRKNKQILVLSILLFVAIVVAGVALWAAFTPDTKDSTAPVAEEPVAPVAEEEPVAPVAEEEPVAPVAEEPAKRVAGTFDGTMNLVLPNKGGSREHVVVEGENVAVISQQYSVSPEGIIELNDLRAPDYVIYVGQTLKIPESISSYSGSDTYAPTGPALKVLDTILGNVGYSRKTEESPELYPWPVEWSTVARPKFEHIDGQPTWRTQAILPGETALYVGSGIWTPVGMHTGCSAGWFVNNTDVTIDIQVLSMSEIVVGNTTNYDAMARELALRTSSGNQCSTAYLGQIPLH